MSTGERKPTVGEVPIPPLQIQPPDSVVPADSPPPVLKPENQTDSDTQDTVIRSPVKALRGILKKPRRYSKDARLPENEGSVKAPRESNEANSAGERVILNVSGQHLDEDETQPNPNTELQTRVPETFDRSSYRIPRGSLQMAAFDRVLFAKRGAELRDEYMREFVEGSHNSSGV